MKWKAAEEFDRYKWHEWFAWYPVKVGLATVWLEVVERRRVRSSVVNWDVGGWAYRDRS